LGPIFGGFLDPILHRIPCFRPPFFDRFLSKNEPGNPQNTRFCGFSIFPYLNPHVFFENRDFACFFGFFGFLGVSGLILPIFGVRDPFFPVFWGFLPRKPDFCRFGGFFAPGSPILPHFSHFEGKPPQNRVFPNSSRDFNTDFAILAKNTHFSGFWGVPEPFWGSRSHFGVQKRYFPGFQPFSVIFDHFDRFQPFWPFSVILAVFCRFDPT